LLTIARFHTVPLHFSKNFRGVIHFPGVRPSLPSLDFGEDRRLIERVTFFTASSERPVPRQQRNTVMVLAFY
jgi:hypothetical protein